MAHFYLAEGLTSAGVGSTVAIEGAEASHAVAVSRARVGEVLSIGNGAGLVATGPVSEAGRDRLAITVDSVVQQPVPSPRLVLVQALAKGGRDESAVQAATELGVDEVVPWAARRSVVRWDASKRARGRERWASIVREATKQCMRPHLPTVQDVESTEQVAQRAAGAMVLVLEPTASELLTDVVADGRDIVLVVGPEGGIDRSELDVLSSAGARAVRLGDSVLRTSTAGPAAIAVLNARLGRW